MFENKSTLDLMEMDQENDDYLVLCKDCHELFSENGTNDVKISKIVKLSRQHTPRMLSGSGYKNVGMPHPEMLKPFLQNSKAEVTDSTCDLAQKIIFDDIPPYLNDSRFFLSKKTIHELTEKNDHELTKKNYHELTEKNYHELTEKNDHEWREKNDHELTKKNDHELTEKDINQPKINFFDLKVNQDMDHFERNLNVKQNIQEENISKEYNDKLTEKTFKPVKSLQNNLLKDQEDTESRHTSDENDFLNMTISERIKMYNLMIEEKNLERLTVFNKYCKKYGLSHFFNKQHISKEHFENLNLKSEMKLLLTMTANNFVDFDTKSLTNLKNDEIVHQIRNSTNTIRSENESSISDVEIIGKLIDKKESFKKQFQEHDKENYRIKNFKIVSAQKNLKKLSKMNNQKDKNGNKSKNGQNTPVKPVSNEEKPKTSKQNENLTENFKNKENSTENFKNKENSTENKENSVKNTKNNLKNKTDESVKHVLNESNLVKNENIGKNLKESDKKVNVIIEETIGSDFNTTFNSLVELRSEKRTNPIIMSNSSNVKGLIDSFSVPPYQDPLILHKRNLEKKKIAKINTKKKFSFTDMVQKMFENIKSEFSMDKSKKLNVKVKKKPQVIMKKLEVQPVIKYENTAYDYKKVENMLKPSQFSSGYAVFEEITSKELNDSQRQSILSKNASLFEDLKHVDRMKTVFEPEQVKEDVQIFASYTPNRSKIRELKVIFDVDPNDIDLTMTKGIKSRLEPLNTYNRSQNNNSIKSVQPNREQEQMRSSLTDIKDFWTKSTNEKENSTHEKENLTHEKENLTNEKENLTNEKENLTNEKENSTNDKKSGEIDIKSASDTPTSCDLSKEQHKTVLQEISNMTKSKNEKNFQNVSDEISTLNLLDLHLQSEPIHNHTILKRFKGHVRRLIAYFEKLIRKSNNGH